MKMHTRKEKQMTEEGYSFELRRYPKHIAYLFDKNKLIAVSTNGWGKHAEMGILQYLRPERQQTLYVRRISDLNSMSRPCVRCSISLKHVSPFLRVFYTDTNGNWIEDDNLDSNHTSRKDYGQCTVGLRLRHKRKICRKC